MQLNLNKHSEFNAIQPQWENWEQVNGQKNC